ncbi:MAG TPA: HEAT repeat domain-containing protein [Vicinamibacterales bacterium]|nr:HEAT repeat domain-containing protein [Vicinamibacterales bacterium]
MSRIGILTTDTDLVIQTWDHALEEMTGISADSARNMRLDEIVPSLSSRALIDLIREPLVSGAPQVLAPALHKFLIPCPPIARSEEFDQMQQRVVVGALRDDQHAVGLVISVEDVTERLEHERRLARELRNATPEVRLKAVEQFELHQPEGLGPLADAMGDQDWRVRRAAVRALAARRDASLVDAVVSALRDGHRNFSLLSSALQLLTLTGVDSTEALIHLMQDPDVDLRIQAALALGSQRRPAAVDALVRALDDPDANVRFHAIESLAKLAPPSAIDRLAYVAESRDFYLAFPAIEALVRIGDPVVLPRLAPLLDDPILGTSAASALGEMGDEVSACALVDAIPVSPTPITTLVEAIVRIHRRYETSFSGGEQIEDIVRSRLSSQGVERILAAINRSSGEALRTLVVVLGWVQDPGIPPALARLLGSADVRHDVIEAFVRVGPSAVTLLIEQLRSADIDITRAAVVALGRIGDRRAVPGLLSLIDDRTRDLWGPVISALARLGDPRSFEPLLGLLGDPDIAVRQAAVGALNSIGHPDMVTRVCGLLDDHSPLLRESAVKIVGYFGYAECVESILERCADPDENVRAAALEHLPYFDDPRMFPVLANTIAQGTPRARAAAAKALGAFSGDDTQVLLEKALDDGEPWVRYFAAISLGRLGIPDTLIRLGRVAETDSATHVRVAAIEAIGTIGGDTAVGILKPLAENADESGLTAIRVLGNARSPAVVSTLQAAARSPEVARRLAAVEALAACGVEEAVEPLQWAASADEDPIVASAAFNALASIANQNSSGSRSAVRAAMKSLTDPGRRADALTVLGRLAPSAIPFVAESLSADDPHERRGVVEVLGRLTHPVASACLQKALSDADAVVRRDAVRALSRFGTRGLARRFSTMAESDVSAAVREAAAVALSRQDAFGEGGE